MGLSENRVPLHPMVLLIMIPMKNGYFIGGIPHFQTSPNQGDPSEAQCSAARYCRDPLIPPPFGDPDLGGRDQNGGDRQMQNGAKKSRSVVGHLGRNSSFSNQAWDFLSIFLGLAHSLLVSRDEQVHKNSFGISDSTDFIFFNH